MRFLRFVVGGLISLALTEHLAARAESPKPEDLIRKMCDFYKGQKSFSVSGESKLQVKVGDYEKKQESDFSLLVERPNRLALRNEGGLTVVSDGKTLSIHFGLFKQYSKSEAPKSLRQLVQNPAVANGMVPWTSHVLVDLAADDPAALILKGVTASKDLGGAKVNGQSARHLKFTQGDGAWEVWIADGKVPVLLRLDHDYSKTLNNPGTETKLTLSETLKWKFDVAPGPKDFTFAPPNNAKEVVNVFKPPEREPKLPEVLGKAAPPVDLERLDGKRVKLADHLGKDVVMLDMWATWCGPCCAELPHLLSVAKDYKAKGVVFYAISVRESKKAVEEFLKKKKLDMAVGLDAKGKVAEAYGVWGIPMLLLIDKKGTVQAVHVGYDEGIEKELHKELDGILAGKNLADATIKNFKAKKKTVKKAKANEQEDKEKNATNEQTAR